MDVLRFLFISLNCLWNAFCTPSHSSWPGFKLLQCDKNMQVCYQAWKQSKMDIWSILFISLVGFPERIVWPNNMYGLGLERWFASIRLKKVPRPWFVGNAYSYGTDLWEHRLDIATSWYSTAWRCVAWNSWPPVWAGCMHLWHPHCMHSTKPEN